MGYCAQMINQRIKYEKMTLQMTSKKSLASVIGLSLFSIMLSACGPTGVDRKLDFSSNKKLGESYGVALSEATPDQQNVLRERSQEILLYIMNLADVSNPALVEANRAAANAAQLEKLTKMSVKDVLAHYLTKEKKAAETVLPLLEKIDAGEGIVLEAVSIDATQPNDITAPVDYLRMKGMLTVRNKLPTDFSALGCKLGISVDNQEVSRLTNSNACQPSTIKAGSTANIAYDTNISGPAALAVSGKLKDGESISWSYRPSDSSGLQYGINNESARTDVGSDSIKQWKNRLELAEQHLAALKKP